MNKTEPIMYSRVVRALMAAGEEPEHVQAVHCERIAELLNREFERLGIQINAEDVRKKKSALEIAEVITEKIAA